MPPSPLVPLSKRFSTLLSRRSAAALVIALGAACLSSGAQTTTPPPYVYTITDLGALPGYSYSAGYAINASGDVAGYSATSTGIFHAVLFQRGKTIDLGVVPGANGSIAYGVNGYDQVTGEVDFPSINGSQPYSHAFLYSAGKMGDIGTFLFPGAPLDFDSGAGTAINDSGQIAGAANTGSVFGGGTPDSAFLYSAEKLTGLSGFYNAVSFFYPYENGAGNNINASGQIAGALAGQDGAFDSNAAIDNTGNGSITTLNPGTLQATAINDSGDATGSTNGLAFLYRKGTVTDIAPPAGLGPYSYGIGINAADQIVGVFGDAQGDNYPFLYTPGQTMIDVNSLLPAGSGWTIYDVQAINDKGQITGDGVGPGGSHAFLLSPVFQSFSTINTVAGTIGKPGTTFAGGGRFVLGAKSNGIYPLAETTVLQLGGYHISIPPGSFVNTNGVYFYQGKIGNATVYAAIRPLGSNAYLIGVVGEGATGLPTSYPYNLTVTIGDDTGTQAITSNYDISNLTEAEVCKDFGLPCGQ